MHRVPSPWRELSLFFVLATGLGVSPAARAETIDSLAQVKKIYVPDFSGGPEARHLHDSFVRHLDRDHFEVVQSAADADATLNGTGEVWLKGYVSINARTPSSDRQAVYAGYLSIEVSGAKGQPIWSWLATPGKLAWSNIVDNLAGRAAKKLAEAAEAQAGQGPATPSAAGSKLAPADLFAAGATFPAPLYQKWFQDFEELHPGVHFRYAPIGSEAGVHKLVAGEVDFAGSDVTPDVIAGGSADHLQRIPAVVGAVVPIYNLEGVTQDLRFTPEALAGIFLGQVRKWDDDAIRRWNRGVDLPSAPITVVHRSDGSGTTWVWSDFLSKASPAWSAVGRGTTLNWPVGTSAAGNDGVAEAVRTTPNSIGYVELTYAIQHRLSYGSVRNRAGEFVRADLESVSESAKGAVLTAGHDATITNAPGRGAYPIAAFTWLVIPTEALSASKRAALLDLSRWALVYGQRDCSALGYAPLPHEVVDEQLRLLGGH